MKKIGEYIEIDVGSETGLVCLKCQTEQFNQIFDAQLTNAQFHTKQFITHIQFQYPLLCRLKKLELCKEILFQKITRKPTISFVFCVSCARNIPSHRIKRHMQRCRPCQFVGLGSRGPCNKKNCSPKLHLNFLKSCFVPQFCRKNCNHLIDPLYSFHSNFSHYSLIDSSNFNCTLKSLLEKFKVDGIANFSVNFCNCYHWDTFNRCNCFRKLIRTHSQVKNLLNIQRKDLISNIPPDRYCIVIVKEIPPNAVHFKPLYHYRPCPLKFIFLVDEASFTIFKRTIEARRFITVLPKLSHRH